MCITQLKSRRWKKIERRQWKKGSGKRNLSRQTWLSVTSLSLRLWFRSWLTAGVCMKPYLARSSNFLDPSQNLVFDVMARYLEPEYQLVRESEIEWEFDNQDWFILQTGTFVWSGWFLFTDRHGVVFPLCRQDDPPSPGSRGKEEDLFVLEFILLFWHIFSCSCMWLPSWVRVLHSKPASPLWGTCNTLFIKSLYAGVFLSY